jgi:hypothetical protein
MAEVFYPGIGQEDKLHVEIFVLLKNVNHWIVRFLQQRSWDQDH